MEGGRRVERSKTGTARCAHSLAGCEAFTVAEVNTPHSIHSGREQILLVRSGVSLQGIGYVNWQHSVSYASMCRSCTQRLMMEEPSSSRSLLD